jgi:predicted RecA/RadA family phage recombinase
MEQRDDRFAVEQRRVFGPFWSVRVVDTLTGRQVPLMRQGAFLLGQGSADRAVKYGIKRYLRSQQG